MSDLFETKEHETPLTPEEQLELIPSLSTRAELNAAERANIYEARMWAMRRRTLKRDDLLTDVFTRDLHRRMFNRVWKWAGKYRTSDRNLGWDWPRIPEGMRALADDAQYWVDHGTYSLPEIAVRLHHRMVVIHPWPNGNGRHARLLADILLAARESTTLTWGADLVSPNQARANYIAALQAADQNDYAPLLAFAKS